VNELMAGGDLEALREKAGKIGLPLTEKYFQNIFKQSLLGLDHIHEHGLMHCDIKEPNIMLKNTDLRNPEVAIIDFGLAHVCAGPGEAGGTPGYIPPETNARHIWYPKGDIFSLGVTFFGLLADKTPNEKLAKFGVFQEGFRTIEDVETFTATRPLPLHLIAGKFPGVMSWLPNMCSKDKKPRPRALQLLETPFFTGDYQPQEGGVTAGAVLQTRAATVISAAAATQTGVYVQQAQAVGSPAVQRFSGVGNATVSYTSGNAAVSYTNGQSALSPRAFNSPSAISYQGGMTVRNQTQQMPTQGFAAATGLSGRVLNQPGQLVSPVGLVL